MSKITTLKAGSKGKFVAVALVSAAFSVSACESLPEGSGGALIGAGLGAAACYLSSANTTECAALVLGGAAVGAVIQNQLNESEREKRDAALAEAVTTGQSTSWQDPESNSSGNIQVLSGAKPNPNGDGTCQDYQESYSGSAETSTYSICKDSSGKVIVE